MGQDETPLPTQLYFRSIAYRDSYIHYFCDAAHPGDGNWIFSNRGRYIPFSNAPLNPELLERTFGSEPRLWMDSISRLIYFEGTDYGHPGLHRIKVNPDGYGLFGLGNEPSWDIRQKNALFRIPTEDGKIASDAAALKTQLLNLLRDTTSEARFAFDWLYLSHHQRQKKLFNFERGNLGEIQRLLYAVLQSQPDIWADDETLRWLTPVQHKHLKRPKKLRDALGVADSFIGIFSAPGTAIKIPPRFKEWRKLLWNYFGPSINEEVLLFSLCIRHWEANINSDPIATEVAPPTAHEQLEALLTLRDWWQQIVPSKPFETFPVQKRTLARYSAPTSPDVP